MPHLCPLHAVRVYPSACLLRSSGRIPSSLPSRRQRSRLGRRVSFVGHVAARCEWCWSLPKHGESNSGSFKHAQDNVFCLDEMGIKITLPYVCVHFPCVRNSCVQILPNPATTRATNTTQYAYVLIWYWNYYYTACYRPFRPTRNPSETVMTAIWITNTTVLCI